MLNNKGMTMIEVIVTIVIISIIMLAVITGYSASLHQDVDTARYQGISDELKVQLDNTATRTGYAKVTLKFGGGSNNDKTVTAEMYVVDSDEEPTVSFAKYVGIYVD